MEETKGLEYNKDVQGISPLSMGSAFGYKPTESTSWHISPWCPTSSYKCPTTKRNLSLDMKLLMDPNPQTLSIAKLELNPYVGFQFCVPPITAVI